MYWISKKCFADDLTVYARCAFTRWISGMTSSWPTHNCVKRVALRRFRNETLTVTVKFAYSQFEPLEITLTTTSQPLLMKDLLHFSTGCCGVETVIFLQLLLYVSLSALTMTI